MNNIEKLYSIYQKQDKLILGLMSGTSLDGLDIALCKFTGNGISTKIELLNFESVVFESSFKEDIKQIFSKKQVDLELLCLLNEKIALIHAQLINKTLKKWGLSSNDIDAIASHGQTVYHSPQIKHQNPNFPNGTLQIGDGDHIAVKTGIITLSDFRQKNIAAGAEGAPLAVYGDFLLFTDNEKSRILLNIGGISNFTYLPATKFKKTIFSTDVGPGNTLSDQFMQKNYNLYFDKDAFYAKQGNINKNLLNALLEDAFFKAQIPKSTGPELFNLEYLKKAKENSNTVNISNEDTLATICEFTATSIAKEIKNIVLEKNEKLEVIASGGGVYNPFLMERLEYHLPNISFKNISDFGITADAKEAVLFALLANETLNGETVEIGIGHDIPKICMGKISFPK